MRRRLLLAARSGNTLDRSVPAAGGLTAGRTTGITCPDFLPGVKRGKSREKGRENEGFLVPKSSPGVFSRTPPLLSTSGLPTQKRLPAAVWRIVDTPFRTTSYVPGSNRPLAAGRRCFPPPAQPPGEGKPSRFCATPFPQTTYLTQPTLDTSPPLDWHDVLLRRRKPCFNHDLPHCLPLFTDFVISEATIQNARWVNLHRSRLVKDRFSPGGVVHKCIPRPAADSQPQNRRIGQFVVSGPDGRARQDLRDSGSLA